MFGLHDKAVTRIHRTAGDGVTGGFFNRQRFAGYHRFIDGAGALEDHTVNRHFFAGADAQAVTDLDRIQRDIALRAVQANDSRDRRGEIQQRMNCRPSPRAGTQFQHLAENDQNNDDARSFKIYRNVAHRRAKRRREYVRYGGSDKAVNECDAGAERN